MRRQHAYTHQIIPAKDGYFVLDHYDPPASSADFFLVPVIAWKITIEDVWEEKVRQTDERRGAFQHVDVVPITVEDAEVRCPTAILTPAGHVVIREMITYMSREEYEKEVIANKAPG